MSVSSFGDGRRTVGAGLAARWSVAGVVVALLVVLFPVPVAAVPAMPGVPVAPVTPGTPGGAGVVAGWDPEDPGDWCGAPGLSSGFVPLPGPVTVQSGLLNANEPKMVDVRGEAGLPSSAVAVQLQVNVLHSAALGWLYLGPSGATSSGVSVYFDSEDRFGDYKSVVVPLSSAGQVVVTPGVLTSHDQVTVGMAVTGYFDDTGTDGAFASVPHRTVLAPSVGVGVEEPGPVSTVEVDVTGASSGVPVDAAAVSVSVFVDAPVDGQDERIPTVVWADDMFLGFAGLSGRRLYATATVPLDGTGRFMLRLEDAMEDPLPVEVVRVGVNGYFGAGSSSYVPVGDTGIRVVDDRLVDPFDGFVEDLLGVGGVGGLGVVGVQAAVHLAPEAGEPVLPGGVASLVDSTYHGSVIPTHGWEWLDGVYETQVPNLVETFIVPARLGDDGTARFGWRPNNVDGPERIRVSVDVLGYFCDRDHPTQPTIFSSSHPPGDWSDAETIEATWTPSLTAPDASGLAGYAVEVHPDRWYQPDPVVVVSEPVWSGPAPAGRTWLHVRPVANDGTAGRTSHYLVQSNSPCSSLETSSYVPLDVPIPIEHPEEDWWTRQAEGSSALLHRVTAPETVPDDVAAVRLSVEARRAEGSPAETGVLRIQPADEALSSGTASIKFGALGVISDVVVPPGVWDDLDGYIIVATQSADVEYRATITGYYADNPGYGYEPLAVGARAENTFQAGISRANVHTIDPTTVWSGGLTGIPDTEVSAVVAVIGSQLESSDTELLARPTGGTEWLSLAHVVPLQAGPIVNAVIPVGPDGRFELGYADGAIGHVNVDVHGWYSDVGSEFHVLPEGSRRLMEPTAVGTEPVRVDVEGHGLPPVGVSALEGALHVTDSPGVDTVIAWPVNMPPQAIGDSRVGSWIAGPSGEARAHSFSTHMAVGTDGDGTGFWLRSNTNTNTYTFDATGYFCRPVPTISSLSHPDEEVVYPPGDFVAEWSIDEDAGTIAGWQVHFDADPDFEFTTLDDPAPTTATGDTYTPGEGESFLFVRAISATGVPSETARFKVTVAADLDDRDLALGLESWWTMDAVPLAGDGAAQVNVATGNVVVQQDDAPPVQAAGNLAYLLRRTYNSHGHDTGLVPGGLFGVDIGDGWSLNLSDLGRGLGGLGGLVGVDLLDLDPGNLDLGNLGTLTMVDRDGTPHDFSPQAVDLAAGPLQLSVTELEDLLTVVTNPADFLQAILDLLADPEDLSSVVVEQLRGLLALPSVQASLDLGELSDSLAICADVRYEAPPGVQVDLWRYLLVDLGASSPNPNGACSLDPGLYDNPNHPVVSLGYVTVRPDRVAQVFGADGRLLRLVDPAGNALAYTYDVLGRLTGIFEPGIDGCTSPTSSGCRSMTVDYDGSDVVVTDPAGRELTYTVTGGLLTRVAARTSTGQLLEEWEYDYDDCGSGETRLCEIHTPRGLDTTDTAVVDPMVFGYNSDDRVVSITEPSDGTDPGVETTFVWTDAYTERVRGDQAVRWAGVDQYGRVSETLVAEPGGFDTPLVHTIVGWDRDGQACTQGHPGGQVRANQVCSTRQIALDGTTGDDRVVEYTYNPEGSLVSERVEGAGGLVDAVSTFGFFTVAYDPFGNPTIVEDSPTGNGDINVPTRPDDVLFTVTAPTATVPPRGNDAGGAWADYRTIFVSDVDPTAPLHTVGTGADCGEGNSGLVCETQAPEGETTVQEFNGRGQLVSTQTAPAGATTYTYFDDSLPGRAGWLHQGIDAHGHAVTYAYDDAANVVAVWDRNAHARAGGSVPTDVDDATQFSYASGVSGAGPWRWETTTTQPVTTADTAAGATHGAQTEIMVDAHGNPTQIRPPRGVIANTGDFDTTTSFDARDLAIETTIPDGDGGTDTTTTSFDDNALPVRTIEPNGRVTGVIYDGAGRATTTIWTRAVSGTPDPGCRTATVDDQDLLDVDEDHVVCETNVEFDSFGQVTETVDPTGHTVTHHFDHFGRETRNTWASAAGTVHTGAGFDLHDNPTVICDQGVTETVASDCGGYAGQTSDLPPGVTVTVFDPADRATSTILTRSPVDDNFEPTGSGVTLATTTTYDTAGRVVSTTDPNGNTTTTAYDGLSRQTAQTVPRAGTTRWVYDPAGNTTAVLRPATPDTLGAIEHDNEWVAVTGYVWDQTHRAVIQVDAAQDTQNFPVLAPVAASGAGDPVINIRTEYGYDPDGNLTGVLAPRAFQSGTVTNPDALWLQRFDYDERGLPVRAHRAEDPSQAGTCTTTGVTGTALARFSYGTTATCVSTTSFDDAGNPVEENTPGGKTVEHSYNLDRLVTTTEATAPDGDGVIEITARYDGAGRVVEATRPGADTAGTPWATTMAYSPDGLATATSETDGTTTATMTNTYDPAGQVVASTTGGTDVVSVTTETGFFSDGHTRVSATGGHATVYGLDLNGNVTTIVQPEGNTVTQTFTDDNLLETRVEQVDTGVERTTTFTYDPVGHKTSETVATGSEVGRGVHYRYQATGWLAEERNGDVSGEAIGYGHNLDGTMATATDTTGPVDVTLDVAWSTTGAQTSQETTVGGVSSVTTAANYRADGETVFSITAHGNQTAATARAYSAGASRPSAATVGFPGQSAITTTTAWTDTGQLDTLNVGTVTVEDRAYRPDGALSSMSGPAGTHTFTSDGHGRTLSHDATGLGGPAQTYGYDPAGRVTGNGTDTFGYDDNNNRVLVETPDQRTESTYRDDNSLETDTITELPAESPVLTGGYPIDPAGRRVHPFLHNQQQSPPPSEPLVSLDDCVYVYDFLNRTVGIGETTADGCVNPDAEPGDDGNYMLTVHDPLNREIAVLTTPDPEIDLDAIVAAGISPSSGTFDAVPTGADVKVDMRVYDLSDQLSRTHTSDHTGGSVVTDIGFYEADGTILHHDSTDTGQGGTQLLGTDGQGNITTITDLAGAVVCQRFYDPFGTTHDDSTCEDDDTINRRWYRGGIQNQTDGTYTYGSRHYDPTTATWTTPDTARPDAPLTDLSIGTDPLTQNRYTYVNGDPINYIDPSGHCPEPHDPEYGRGTCVPVLDGWVPIPSISAGYERCVSDAQDGMGNLPLSGFFAKEACKDYAPSSEHRKAGRTCPYGSAMCWVAYYLDHGLDPARIDDVIAYYCDGPGDGYTGAGCQSGAAVPDRFADFFVIDVPSGLFAGGIVKGVSALALRPSHSPWSLAPGPRGLAVERVLGGNLPRSFPTIDRFAKGTVTSIKSIDLTATSYQSAGRLTSRLNRYVEDVVRFEGAAFDRRVITRGMIDRRELVVAVRPGAGSSAQRSALRDIVEYGASRGVDVRVVAVP